MHGAVGEEHPAQPVGFQPVAIEEDEALAGFALQLQPLAYLIKIPGVGGGGALQRAVRATSWNTPSIMTTLVCNCMN